MNDLIVLTLKPEFAPQWDALAANWREPRLGTGWPLDELHALDGFTRSFAEKALAVGIENGFFAIGLNDLQIEVRGEALRWLRCKKNPGHDLAWSPQMAFYYEDQHWHGQHLSRAWAIKHARLLARPLNPSEVAWLHSWNMLGPQDSPKSAADDLLHITSSRGAINHVNEAHRDVSAPPWPTLENKPIELARAASGARETSWSRLQEKRHSDIHAGEPLHLAQLGQLLDLIFHTAREARPYPSAGGLYSLQAIVDVTTCTDLGAGLYLYNPATHSLQKFSETTSHHRGVQLVFAADFSSLQAKYRWITYRLALLDAGVLFHQTALAIACCGLEGTPQGWNVDTTKQAQLRKLLGSHWKALACYDLAGRC
jgi:SagB-type dehydrogenase family enzyme